MGYRINDRDKIPLEKTQIFSLLRRMKTDSRAHPIPHQIGTGVKLEPHFHLVPMLKILGAVCLLLHNFSGRGA
jgi:hypothetical protein